MSDLDRKGAENRLEGAGHELKGKLRNAAGALTGDSAQQLSGKGEELKGKVQRAWGNVQNDVDDAADDANKDVDRNQTNRKNI